MSLIGSPTAAALLVTEDLLLTYEAWLHYERSILMSELGRTAAERQVIEWAASP